MGFDAAFWDDHYDALYGSLGVDAVLDGHAVTVIDKSTSLNSSGTLADLVVIHSAKAVAAVRVNELARNGLARDDVNNMMLTFNGATWRVKVTEPFPSPAGIDHGEYYLVLVNDG